MTLDGRGRPPRQSDRRRIDGRHAGRDAPEGPLTYSTRVAHPFSRIPAVPRLSSVRGPAVQTDSAPPVADASDAAHRRTQAHDIAVALRNGAKLAGSLMVTWSVAMIVKLQVPAHLGPIRQGQFGFAESFAGMFFTTIGLGIDTYVMKEVSVRPKHASEFTGRRVWPADRHQPRALRRDGGDPLGDRTTARNSARRSRSSG